MNTANRPNITQNNRRTLEQSKQAKTAEKSHPLVYGSKKTRNQANCSQFFTRPELKSKGNTSGMSVRSAITNKSTTKVIRRNRGDESSSMESSFQDRVNKQLKDKLQDVRQPFGMREVDSYQDKLLKARDIRIVDDERSKNSLAMLAEQFEFVPKHIGELQRPDSYGSNTYSPSHYKSSHVDMLNITGKATNGEWQPSFKPDRTIESKFISTSKLTGGQLERSNLPEASRERRHPSEISQEGGHSSWKYIEFIENKVQSAINRSKSRHA
jgi:hypothetical protein